ncbi:MAG: nuclear transport factor 2 family protein [Clostridia bacterium]|nr:nuclear transport factor 2 family protein [Clostridia bacterium]
MLITAEAADRIELKDLVDRFSVAADDKDAQAQTLMFTEDATVDSYRGSELISSYKGREAIGNAFGSFLARFDTVFHINGQQTVKIDGDTATGTAYCQVVLIGKNEEGKNVMTTQGVRYTDTYKKVNGEWLIASRASNFVWTDTKVVE